MRSFTALACTIAVTACSGTDGDILRTRSDGSVTQRPRPAPLSTWQIQLSGALDTTVDARSYIVDVATPAAVISRPARRRPHRALLLQRRHPGAVSR